MTIRFGPAGNSNEFYDAGFKHSVEVPIFLSGLGLNAFEYQCGRGVHIGEKTANELGERAKAAGIALSIHAPYYISLASPDEQKRRNSVQYIIQSAVAAKQMGATRIVVHPGGLGKLSRKEATALAMDTLRLALDALRNEGLEDITICPETMGKINQLGNLEEVLEFCTLSDHMVPCIDFGHMNSREQGAIKTKANFAAIVDRIGAVLGEQRMKTFHAHFSKIEYSKGGEVRHLTFEDTIFGPNFEPLMDLVHERSLCPTFICESAGTQAMDAKKMKDYYELLGE